MKPVLAARLLVSSQFGRPLHTCERGDRARASVEPGRLLDNGNNKVGQEKGERGGEEQESS